MNSTNLIFFLIGSLAAVFFFVAFLIIWYKRRYELKPYFTYGLLAGGILFSMQMLFILLDSEMKSSLLVEAFGIIIWLLIDFFKMMIFTTVGMDYAEKLRYPLYLRTHSGVTKIKDSILKHSQCMIPTLVVAVLSIVYSVILFKFTNPEIARSVTQLFDDEINTQNLTYSPATFVASLIAAFGEEIIYRLGIQNYLAIHLNWRNSRYWLAILVTTVIWTIAHVGVLHPNWVKFAQIFPIGLLLGWLFRKYGIISCILAHGLFNVILPLLLVIENYTIDTIVFNYLRAY